MHARYRIENTIGHGGMGVIHRAYDYLTGSWVVLKQLSLEPEEMTPEALATMRLALAAEFRILATLRHPHIVSVLDYGFVGESAFYTMELLSDTLPLVQAARQQPLAGQLQLLVQLLQALEYIRRHGVVHRDLKPANVLVQHGQVKVLDFGLAVLEGQQTTSAGSVFYMAPETLAHNRATTHAADLFAVGVMAYEILAGQHPFAANSLKVAVEKICHTEPDYALLQGPASLRPVVARLLAKDPTARFPTAYAALVALVEASTLPLLLETQAIRASLLQAAPLVGRETELTQLSTALTQALAGHGSAWLVAGESGVGKSRLLEELRIQALIQSAYVWHGQAVSEGGLPAQLWRTILRWLALSTTPSDLEASVLKPFVPQLEGLLARPIADAPALTAQAAQDRFCGIVLALLRRVAARHPIVLILEDLHWAGPFSRAVLAWLMRAVGELPVLLVATYRQDERPNLPAELPAAQHLTLARLNRDQVTTLTSAIFGLPSAQLTALSTFLYQQTEGNAFFVVEVLRSLAEEAGLLSQVQSMALPAHIQVGGMQQVIQSRLQRITAHDYPWLEVAAVAGRELDLPLLRQLNPSFDWAAWLSRCAEAAVIEPQGAAWHFAHNQVRQAVLASLPEAQHPALHQTIATGLEQAYAANLLPHVGRLAHHYAHTHQPAKHRHYLWLAGQTAQAAYDYAKALGYYEQLAALGGDAPDPIDFQLRYGAMLEGLGRWPEAEAAYQAALAAAIAGPFGPAMAQAQKALGTLARQRGDYAAALTWLTTAQTHADSLVLAQTLTEIGTVYLNRSDYAQAKAHLEAGLALARAQGDMPTAALALNGLGTSEMFQGNYAPAQALFAESLALHRALGDRPGIALTLGNLGVVSLEQAQLERARDFFEECLVLWRELGNKNYVGRALTNLGHLACLEGRYADANTHHTESLTLRRELGNKAGIALSLENLGLVTYFQGTDYGAALQQFAESLSLSQSIGNKRLMQGGLVGLAATYAALGQVARAVQLAAAAETLREAIHLALEAGEQQLYENAIVAGKKTLTPPAFDTAWAAGVALPLEAAVAYALGVG